MTEKTALAKQKTMKALKKNPKKSATGVLTIVGIVVGVVLGTSLAVGVALHRRTFRYTGDAHAQVAGAAMGAAGRRVAHPSECGRTPSPPLPFPCSKPWRTRHFRHPNLSSREAQNIETDEESRRRRMEAVADVLTEYTGTLGLCPRDSQVIVEHEATRPARTTARRSSRRPT